MSHRIKVKICGLTNAGDAQAALDAGADYLGFVLYSKSPRGIRPASLVALLDRVNVPRAVGVFVNEGRAVVERVAGDCGLYAVQMHGDEAADDFVDMPVPVWRAVAFCAGRYEPDPADWPADRYVVDAAVPGKYGGTGEVADWDQAATLARRCAVMLSGGLTPVNVADAVRAVRPAGVDTASGVEAQPGKKDHAAMEAFVNAVRGLE